MHFTQRTTASQPRRRRRPSHAEWQTAIDELLDEQELHGWLPYHVVEQTAARLGVRPTSLETRFDQAVRQLVQAAGWRFAPQRYAIVVQARHFADAYRRLIASGVNVPYAVVERAIWTDTGNRTLVALRTAERRRRQRLAETASCTICDERLAAA